MAGVFISYRRGAASAVAGRLSDRLRSELGDDAVFMDVDALEPGVDFVAAIDRAVREADALLVVIHPDWADVRDPDGRRRLDDPQDYVRLEVASALDAGLLVIPVLVQGATMPRAEDLPDRLATLATRHAAHLSHERWSTDLEPLLRVVRREVEERQVDTGPAPGASAGSAADDVAAAPAPASRPPGDEPSWAREIVPPDVRAPIRLPEVEASRAGAGGGRSGASASAGPIEAASPAPSEVDQASEEGLSDDVVVVPEVGTTVTAGRWRLDLVTRRRTLWGLLLRQVDGEREHGIEVSTGVWKDRVKVDGVVRLTLAMNGLDMPEDTIFGLYAAPGTIDEPLPMDVVLFQGGLGAVHGVRLVIDDDVLEIGRTRRLGAAED